MTKETYIGKAIKNMLEYNVSVSFVKRKNNSKNSASEFDCWDQPNTECSPKLTVNYFDNDYDTFFNFFIHEYCHFLQWKEYSDVWKNGRNAWIAFISYLNGNSKYFSKNQLLKIQHLELDCEKRVLAEIKNNKLKINVKNYIKEANSYIYSYNLILENRKFDDRFDYFDPELLKIMPSRLIGLPNIQKRIEKYDLNYYQQIGK